MLVCITTGPVFFCAAIYVTLSRTIVHLDASISRFPPSLLYWTFIPFDINDSLFTRCYIFFRHQSTCAPHKVRL